MFSTQQYFGFDPRTLPGCALWLDAQDPNGNGSIPSGGSSITTWTDKSGAGKNFTATGTVTFNTSPSRITLNGSSYLENTTITDSVFTVFYVYQKTSGSGALFTNNNTLNNTGFFPRQSGTGLTSITTSDSTFFQQTSTIPDNSINNLVVQYDSSNNIYVHLNGTLNLQTTVAGTITRNRLTLGYRGANNDYMTGSYYEIVYFNTALTTAQRQQVEGYLAWKWGLQANLPTGHSFRPNPTAMRIFQPNDIAGLQLWFDGLDPNGNGTVPANNAALSTWVDKSGTGNSGSASGTTPLYQSGSGVLFSTGAYLTNYSASLTNESLFFVYTPTTSTASIVLAGPSANGGRTLLNNTNLRLESSSYFVAFGSLTPDGTVPLNQRCQSAYVITSGSSVVVHNGVTYSPVSLSFTAGLTTRIGAAGSTLTQFFKGTIHEVIAYNVALTASQRQQIEGYLASKWRISGSLPTTQPYYLQRALPSTPLFTPVNVSNCRLWLDAADRSRITFGTGSNISNWTDKSSNGYTFSQATSISQAVYVENSLNGLPVVSLTTNKGLTGTTFSPNGLTAMSLFAVVNNTGNQNPATNTNFQFLGWNETGGWGQVYLGAYTPFMEWRFGTGQAENKPFANFQSNVGASYNVLSVSKSGTSEPAYRNGTLLSNYTAANTTISGTGSTTRIGLNSAQNNLAELIVYSGAITTRERQQIEGYLAWKWGLQNSLPTTHPYYKFRP